jgi:hypothetical protein
MLACVAALAAGCAQGTTNMNGGAPAVAVETAEAALRDTLDYFNRWRGALAPELGREIALLGREPRTEADQMRLAMLLSLQHGSGDLNRAITLLDAVLKSRRAAAWQLRPLAGLLATQLAAQSRLEEQAEKLGLQVREERKRADSLGEKLEALKGIESSLPARPQSAPVIKDAR